MKQVRSVLRRVRRVYEVRGFRVAKQSRGEDVLGRVRFVKHGDEVSTNEISGCEGYEVFLASLDLGFKSAREIARMRTRYLGAQCARFAYFSSESSGVRRIEVLS